MEAVRQQAKRKRVTRRIGAEPNIINRQRFCKGKVAACLTCFDNMIKWKWYLALEKGAISVLCKINPQTEVSSEAVLEPSCFSQNVSEKHSHFDSAG